MKKFVSLSALAFLSLNIHAFADEKFVGMGLAAVAGVTELAKKTHGVISVDLTPSNAGTVGGFDVTQNGSSGHYDFKIEEGNYASTTIQVIGCAPVHGAKVKLLVGYEGYDTTDGQRAQGDIGICKIDKSGETFLYYGGGQREDFHSGPGGVHSPVTEIVLARVTPIGKKLALSGSVGYGGVAEGICDHFKFIDNNLVRHPYDAQKDPHVCNHMAGHAFDLDAGAHFSVGNGPQAAIAGVEVSKRVINTSGTAQDGSIVTGNTSNTKVNVTLGFKIQ